MKKTALFVIILMGLSINPLLSQSFSKSENKITIEDIRKESTAFQEIFFDKKEKNKSVVLVRADYFLPSDQLYKDVYGGGFQFGGEIVIPIWKGISLYLGAGFFSKKGAMIPFGEETTISLIPVEFGILYKFSKSKINPYVGAGAGYYSLSEESFLGKVTGGNVGFFGQAGVSVELSKFFVIDISAKYNVCNLTIDAIENNIGGIRIGMGFGVGF